MFYHNGSYSVIKIVSWTEVVKTEELEG